VSGDDGVSVLRDRGRDGCGQRRVNASPVGSFASDRSAPRPRRIRGMLRSLPYDWIDRAGPHARMKAAVVHGGCRPEFENATSGWDEGVSLRRADGNLELTLDCHRQLSRPRHGKPRRWHSWKIRVVHNAIWPFELDSDDQEDGPHVFRDVQHLHRDGHGRPAHRWSATWRGDLASERVRGRTAGCAVGACHGRNRQHCCNGTEPETATVPAPQWRSSDLSGVRRTLELGCGRALTPSAWAMPRFSDSRE
jgi:hypothetical protein